MKSNRRPTCSLQLDQVVLALLKKGAPVMSSSTCGHQLRRWEELEDGSTKLNIVDASKSKTRQPARVSSSRHMVRIIPYGIGN